MLHFVQIFAVSAIFASYTSVHCIQQQTLNQKYEIQEDTSKQSPGYSGAAFLTPQLGQYSQLAQLGQSQSAQQQSPQQNTHQYLAALQQFYAASKPNQYAPQQGQSQNYVLPQNAYQYAQSANQYAQSTNQYPQNGNQYYAYPQNSNQNYAYQQNPNQNYASNQQPGYQSPLGQQYSAASDVSHFQFSGNGVNYGF